MIRSHRLHLGGGGGPRKAASSGGWGSRRHSHSEAQLFTEADRQGPAPRGPWGVTFHHRHPRAGKQGGVLPSADPGVWVPCPWEPRAHRAERRDLHVEASWSQTCAPPQSRSPLPSVLNPEIPGARRPHPHLRAIRNFVPV